MDDPMEVFSAIDRGDPDALRRILREHPEWLESRGEDHETPLRAAVEFDDLELVKLLLELGAQTDAEHQDGFPALHAALETDDDSETETPDSVEITRCLIEAGASLSQLGWSGWAPLHLAATRNQLKKARLLLEAGAAVNQRTEIDGTETPLMRAAYLGHPGMTRLLLSFGADPSLCESVFEWNVAQIAVHASQGPDANTIAILQDVSPASVAAYRDCARELARNGDHEGVLRVLAEHRPEDSQDFFPESP